MAGRFEILSVFKSVDKTTVPVTRMANRFNRLTSSAQRSLRSVNRFNKSILGGLRSIGRAAKYSLFGGAGLIAGFGLLMREFARVETAQAAFTPLLGGIEKATKLVKILQKTAADTPFGFKDLAKQAKFLLPVMNSDIKKTTDLMSMIGDTAGGNAISLESITRGVTKAMLKGRTDMESLNMIAEAGVPIFTELAKSMGGRVGPAFFKLVSAGRISTTQLVAAFRKMTSEGGIFFNAMEIFSKTLEGRFNALKDNTGQLAAEVGGIFAPEVKNLVELMLSLVLATKEWVKANREVIDEKFKEFIDDVKVGIQGIVDWAKALTQEDFEKFYTGLKDTLKVIRDYGPLVLKLIGYFLLFAAAVSILNTFVAAFNLLAMLNPWVALILLLIGAAALIIEYWEPLKKWFKEFWADVSDYFTEFMLPITRFLDDVGRFTGLIEDDTASLTYERELKGPQTPAERQVQSIMSRSPQMQELMLTLRAEEGTSATIDKDSFMGTLNMFNTGNE